MSKLYISDSRALLNSPASPAYPADAESVASCFEAGLRLRLRAHKAISTYEAWLWEGNDGQAYFSKRFANGKTQAWKAGATIDRALSANARSMVPVPSESAEGAVPGF